MDIMSNQSINNVQKRQAMDNVDKDALQADWLVDILRMCGYIIWIKKWFTVRNYSNYFVSGSFVN